MTCWVTSERLWFGGRGDRWAAGDGGQHGLKERLFSPRRAGAPPRSRRRSPLSPAAARPGNPRPAREAGPGAPLPPRRGFADRYSGGPEPPRGALPARIDPRRDSCHPPRPGPVRSAPAGVPGCPPSPAEPRGARPWRGPPRRRGAPSSSSVSGRGPGRPVPPRSSRGRLAIRSRARPLGSAQARQEEGSYRRREGESSGSR